MIDQNRATVAKNVDFEARDIAQGNIFKRAPDDEDYSGCTGNEGVSTTHFYHDTVALLVSRKWRVDFEFKSVKSNPQGYTSVAKPIMRSKQLRRRVEKAGARKTLRAGHGTEQKDSFISFRSLWIREDGVYSDDLLTAVAVAAIDLDDVLLLEEVVPMFTKEPQLRSLCSSEKLFQGLGLKHSNLHWRAS